VFGDGPPVVLVHGTPGRSVLWRKVVPVLAERHAVHVFDLLGFGESERREDHRLRPRGDPDLANVRRRRREMPPVKEARLALLSRELDRLAAEGGDL
jgi:pimeloyl-ACP methyl ester carboxylesterase